MCSSSMIQSQWDHWRTSWSGKAHLVCFLLRSSACPWHRLWTRSRSRPLVQGLHFTCSNVADVNTWYYHQSFNSTLNHSEILRKLLVLKLLIWLHWDNFACPIFQYFISQFQISYEFHSTSRLCPCWCFTKKSTFYIIKFEAWNVAKSQIVRGGGILSKAILQK